MNMRWILYFSLLGKLILHTHTNIIACLIGSFTIDQMLENLHEGGFFTAYLVSRWNIWLYKKLPFIYT